MKNDLKSELDCLLKGTKIGFLEEQPEVLVVPTRFVGLNRATKIGGVPASSVLLVYGPSQGGKTAFALGLVESFQRLGHLAVFVDAEHTLDKVWADKCGVDLENLAYERPDTYEETVSKIQKIFNNFRKGRDTNKIHPSRALIVVVDSINKLIPEEEVKNFKAQTKVGRGFPIRALFNTEWLDRIHATIHNLPVLLVVLAHEKKKLDAKPFEVDKRIKGGSGLYYDSTVVVRIETQKIVRQEIDEKKVEVAHVHEGWVEKNKVGVCHEKFKFFMSTGREIPVGFDLVREVMEEAQLRGETSCLIRETGANWKHPALKKGKVRGDGVLRELLRLDPELLQLLIDDLNRTATDFFDVDDDE